MAEEPKLVNRRANHKSSIQIGRTIAEKRERLETKNERTAARKKDKLKNIRRIIIVSIGFIILIGILVYLGFIFFKENEEDQPTLSGTTSLPTTYEPTVEIIDEDATTTGGKITSRMREYIGMAEADFKDLGYVVSKVVLPTGAVREVDVFLEGHNGFIKLVIDRDSAISAEDADRMIRYLEGQGITDYQYIDVRLDSKAYWK